MESDLVQAQYDQLERIAQKFQEQATLNAQLFEQIKNSVHALENGAWEGRGAQAFYKEMNHIVYPALTRLTAAFHAGQATLLQIARLLHDAEEEAADPFRHGENRAIPLRAAHSGETVLQAAQGAAFLVGTGGPVASTGAAAAPRPAFVIDPKDLKKYYGKANGNGQCAGLAQNHFNSSRSAQSIGAVKSWRAGAKLSTHPALTPGTVIATFDANGRYPNKSHGNHVAIFLDYQRDSSGKITGIKVLDQWSGRPAGERVLEFVPDAEAARRRSPASASNGGLLVNQANDMYVVTRP
ncbi:MAG: WXG100 family type VII secretion target [Caldilineaceae bacterium]|nr:WXG100 family type VII secretion target [Caldilineaceae bacterium]